jgi:hypothetical protein
MTPKNGSSWLVTYGQDMPHTHADRPYTEFITTYTSPSKHGFSYVAEYFHIVDEVDHLHHERLTLNRQINDDWTSSAVLQHKRRDTPYIDGHSFILYDLELAYRSTFDIVYTSETTNQVDAKPDQWELWEAKYHPDDEQELHVTYGSRRAGYVCSGGVCRLEPAFDGTKVEYLLRF